MQHAEGYIWKIHSGGWVKNSLEDKEISWELLELSLWAKIGALTKALTVEIGGDRFEGHLDVEFDRT